MAATAENDPHATTGDRHRRFWDDWNRTWRFQDGHDEFMTRQVAILREVLGGLPADASVLDVGCGTGWLANEAVTPGRRVVGTDLSPEAIASGQERFASVDLRCGDFLELELDGPFGLVMSSDALVPMPDHARCIGRVAELQRPGGVFLLMTQNPFVWRRRSKLRPHDPSVPNGHVDQWPTKARVAELLGPYYAIERQFTFEPGGDKGLLFWVEHRIVRGAMGRLVGRQRWRGWLERAGLGRELVIVAVRR